MRKILLLFLLYTVPLQAQAACASKYEKQSLEMRALQSELMVAALACGKKAEYNFYVSRFTPDLRWHGKQLRSFFNRTYGAASEKKLNQFVTQMANQASRLSLSRNNAQYCNHANRVFHRVNAAMPWQVIDYAKMQYATWHNVQSCDAQQVVALIK